VAEKQRTVRRIVKIPKEYFEVIEKAERLFELLYQFENGLRLAIYNFLTSSYGSNWWDVSLKNNLPTIYEYANDKIKRRRYMPYIAESTLVKPFPMHYVTLGHLEEIVKKYRSDCIPGLFPSIDFFMGHMYLIKEIRNLFCHMFPGITNKDVQYARNAIKLLAEHINIRLMV